MSVVCLNLDEMTMKIKDDTWIQSLALHKLSMVTQEAQKFEVILGSIASWGPPWDYMKPCLKQNKSYSHKESQTWPSEV